MSSDQHRYPEEEETFIEEPPDDLRCPICLHVLTDPCQTSCGHRFCLECIEAVKQTSNPVCPIDRKPVEGGVFQDNAARMQIQRLRIHCPYKLKGCKWTGDLSDRNSHLKMCEYSIRECDHCTLVVQVSQIDTHYEVCPRLPLTCEHCHGIYPRNELESHDAKCSKAPVHCPNGCNKSLVREVISTHCTLDCPQQPVSCPLENFGCVDKVPREEIASHVKGCASEHLAMLALLVLEQSREIDSLKKMLDSQHNTITSLEQTCYPSQPQFTWRIDDIRGQIKSIQAKSKPHLHPLYSPAFFTSEGGYKLGLCIYPAGDNNHDCLSLYFVIMRGPFDDVLPWPFQKRVCLFLINCRGSPDIVKEIYPDSRLHYFKKPTEPRNVGFGYPKFMPLSSLLNEESEFVANGALFIRVIVVN